MKSREFARNLPLTLQPSSVALSVKCMFSWRAHSSLPLSRGSADSFKRGREKLSDRKRCEKRVGLHWIPWNTTSTHSGSSWRSRNSWSRLISAINSSAKVLFNFGVGRIPFSDYWPSGVIRMGSPVWKWTNVKKFWRKGSWTGCRWSSLITWGSQAPVSYSFLGKLPSHSSLQKTGSGDGNCWLWSSGRSKKRVHKAVSSFLFHAHEVIGKFVFAEGCIAGRKFTQLHPTYRAPS